MSGDQREFLSVEEIKERIRGRVRAFADSELPSENAPVEEPPALALHRLNQLRRQLRTSSFLLQEVGAINPRPSGWGNAIVQFLKRCIQRSLTWVLRPLQHFNSSVLEAAEESTHILEDFQLEVRRITERLNVLERSLRGTVSEPAVQVHERSNGASPHTDIECQLALLRTEVQHLRMTVEDLKQRRTGNG